MLSIGIERNLTNGSNGELCDLLRDGTDVETRNYAVHMQRYHVSKRPISRAYSCVQYRYLSTYALKVSKATPKNITGSCYLIAEIPSRKPRNYEL